jgi:predicted HAD superfamily phosphohydrolase YqeG
MKIMHNAGIERGARGEAHKRRIAGLESLDIGNIRDATVIVDIDGTMTADRQLDCSVPVLAVIRSLASQNAVYLCSNHRDSVRNRAIARRAGLTCIETRHRKPSKKVLESLPSQRRARQLIVIGDKSTVDGVFAWRVGARFIRVARIVSPEDRLVAKVSYFLDDLVSRIWDCARASRARLPFLLPTAITPNGEAGSLLDQSRRL